MIASEGGEPDYWSPSGLCVHLNANSCTNKTKVRDIRKIKTRIMSVRIHDNQKKSYLVTNVEYIMKLVVLTVICLLNIPVLINLYSNKRICLISY